MAITQTQIDLLTAAVLSGTKQTTVDGLTVVNQSTRELLEALKYANSSLVASDPTRRNFRIQRFVSPGTAGGR